MTVLDLAVDRLADGSGREFDAVTEALRVAAELPQDGPEAVLRSLGSGDGRWAVLIGAREILRTIVLADATELMAAVALGLVAAAVRLEVDARCSGAAEQL